MITVYRNSFNTTDDAEQFAHALQDVLKYRYGYPEADVHVSNADGAEGVYFDGDMPDGWSRDDYETVEKIWLDSVNAMETTTTKNGEFIEGHSVAYINKLTEAIQAIALEIHATKEFLSASERLNAATTQKGRREAAEDITFWGNKMDHYHSQAICLVTNV